MICKNCEDNTRGNYCHSCGQKTDTRRLTVKHFITHDVIHGMFHLDKGLPQTLKQIFIRPGTVARDYIFGKRKRYYNFFYLLLLIIGLYLFLLSFQEAPKELNEIEDDTTVNFSNYFKQYRKAVIFSWIPILTVAAALIFRRLKFSIVEFAIPSTIAVIGSSLFNVLLTATNQFIPIQSIKHPLIYAFITLLSLSVFLFPLFTFATFLKGHYTTLGKIWRLIAFYVLCIFLLIIALISLMLIISDGKASQMTFG